MNQDSELTRLERFVEKLLASFAELRQEKAQLIQKLAERDSLIEELQGNISSQDSERGEISHRVNRIVNQIEEWEKTIDAEEVEVPGNYDSDFVPDQPTAEDEGEADEAERVQHNLFSIEESK